MKKIIAALIISIISTSIFADDLYKINIFSKIDAENLKTLDCQPIWKTIDGYLVLVPYESISELERLLPDNTLISKNISLSDLYIHKNHKKTKYIPRNIIYEDESIRIVIKDLSFDISNNYDYYKLPVHQNIKIEYSSKETKPPMALSYPGGLDTLINLISQDSLDAYLHHLEAFNGRLTGTQSSYNARDWIFNKFVEFGYDSVYNDPFNGYQLGFGHVQSYNVVATKVGSVYPDIQIVVGAHYDAVPDSPGADDNGSGTVAVLELARVLKNIETDITFVFITFDSEESGLFGSYHYAYEATLRNDNIIFMMNLDMIGHYENSTQADIYYGTDDSYALLWKDLSESLVNIIADLGHSGSSDHVPFQSMGIESIFVQEKIFSDRYHQPYDSTTYIDFTYMTKMVKGSMATLVTIDHSPPPADLNIFQDGNGTSLYLSWNTQTYSNIDHFEINYKLSSSSVWNKVDVPSTQSNYTIKNLTEYFSYDIFIKVFDIDNDASISNQIFTVAPLSIPESPLGISASPLRSSIILSWNYNNRELDFDYYKLYRDGLAIANVYDTTFIDSDPNLGDAVHEYFVTAVDTDGYESDKLNPAKVSMRAAVLYSDKIMIINKSSTSPGSFVDEIETQSFITNTINANPINFTYTLKDANYDLSFLESIEFGMIIIAASGKGEELYVGTNILPALDQYLKIGGKVIIFGRWGFVLESPSVTDYSQSTSINHIIYNKTFHINTRTRTVTQNVGLDFIGDLIGAKSIQTGWPDLNWDVTLTNQHTSPFTAVNGIPFLSHIDVDLNKVDVLYTYDSFDNDPLNENKPVAWKYIGTDYHYFFFDIPLSFFNRPIATQVLQQAITELYNTSTDVNDDGNDQLPDEFILAQNYPNPFNPATTIEYNLPYKTRIRIAVFNILGQQVKVLIDEIQPVGKHTVIWDGTNENGQKVSSGIYLYRIKSEDFNQSKKMLLLK